MNMIQIMRKTNLIGIDLNLLRVFAMVMQERSLTRAARRLSVGQPAVSHALARLRSELDDVLFVRSGRAMEPTEWARSFHAEIAPALDRIERSLGASRSFDPGTTERTFSLGMSDDLQMAFLPELMRAITENMPKARLIVRQTDYTRAAEMLERQDVSMVVGYLDKLPASAKLRKLMRVGYRIVLDGGQRDVTTLSDYCSRRHALVTFVGDLTGYVDETLRELGVSRDIAISLSNFAVAPYVLRETGLVATVPRYLAVALAGQPGLKIGTLPFESPEFDVSIAWSLTTDSDPGEQLIRSLVIDVVGGSCRWRAPPISARIAGENGRSR